MQTAGSTFPHVFNQRGTSTDTTAAINLTGIFDVACRATVNDIYVISRPLPQIPSGVQIVREGLSHCNLGILDLCHHYTGTEKKGETCYILVHFREF